jgi:aryl-alcohol dehydrogenase-like predicted oxidoreductase
VQALDTAEAYGQAEQKLGRIGLSDFMITTKIRLGRGDKPDSIPEKVRQSLERLGVTKVANLLLHNEERLEEKDAKKVAQSMHELVTRGLTDRVGLSSYNPDRALDLCGQYGFQVVQVPANALDQRIFQHQLLESFSKKGVEVQIRSVFLQGLLLADPPATRRVPDSVQKHARNFRAQCVAEGLSLVRGALSQVLDPFHQSKVVVGVVRSEELAQIVQGMESSGRLKCLDPNVWQPEFDPRTWS